jgi:hypothetical protein
VTERWRLMCSVVTGSTNDSFCWVSGLDSLGSVLETSESELLSLLLEAASMRRIGTDLLVLNSGGAIVTAQIYLGDG